MCSLIFSCFYFIILMCSFTVNSDRDISDINPEAFLNTTQILQKYNYKTKSYKVITKDGYYLNLVRMVNKGPPILLVHGFCESADSWVVQGPRYSLAFKLANDGYDIWLFNARGNTYSKGHSRKLSKKSYWNFSYEEVGTFDLPATIDFILSKTNQRKITYIGFSQGTTSFFVLCSLKPEYSSKIHHAILLSPVAWLDNVTHTTLRILSSKIDLLKFIIEKNEIYELFSSNEEIRFLQAKICNITSPESWFCTLEAYGLTGLDDLSKILPDRLPIISSHMQAGCSSKTLLHYLQGYISKRFGRFNEGSEQNLKIYFSSLPPEYDVSRISVPMTLFISENDWFLSYESVMKLKGRITAPNRFIIIDKNLQFTHLEYVYGTRSLSIITRPILNIVRSVWQV